MKNLFLPLLLILLVFNKQYGQIPMEKTPKYEVNYFCPPCGCPQDGKHFDAPGICHECNMAFVSQLKGLEDKPRNRMSRKTAAVVLFNGADIMDVTGPMSVFEHAGFSVLTVAKDEKPKNIGMYTQLHPDHTFESLPEVDVIVVPGGGPAESNQDIDIVNWLRERDERTDTMFSVCSGAFFLGLAGLLDANEATTFASLIPNLRTQFPEAKVLNDVKYTNNGHIITSSGLSSGIDASFEVVAKYYGVGRAQAIANRMEYPWKRKHDYARSQLADNYITPLGNLVQQFATKYHYSEGDMNEWEFKYIIWDGVNNSEFMALMTREFEKLPDFEWQHQEKGLLEGTYHHSVLGRGKILFKLTETDMGPEVSLKAHRIQNQTL